MYKRQASGDTAQFQVEVTVPDTAGQDEYALVRITVTSNTTEYSHIDGESWANTTASDGRIYGVDLQPDSGSRQAIPGGLAEYVFTVTNSGNETDTILLEVDMVRHRAGPRRWTAIALRIWVQVSRLP